MRVWLIVVGIVLVGLGALFLFLGKLGPFRIPGNLEFGGEHWKVYVPIGTCVVLSLLLLTLVVEGILRQGVWTHSQHGVFFLAFGVT